MNKLLIITVLVTLVALSAECFRLPRQAVEEKTDILTKIIDTIKSYYEELPGNNLQQKVEERFYESMMGVGMSMAVIQDYIDDLLYPRQ